MIPLSFVASHVDLDWPDLRWGYEHKMLSWKDAADYAKLKNESEYSQYGKKIASIDKNTAHLLEYELQRFPHTEASKQKWLYLCISWVYANRDKLEDPFEDIEKIFADFDYPDDIAPFVRFMPSTDGYDAASHSKKENHDRMLAKWREYVERGFIRG